MPICAPAGILNNLEQCVLVQTGTAFQGGVGEKMKMVYQVFPTSRNLAL